MGKAVLYLVILWQGTKMGVTTEKGSRGQVMSGKKSGWRVLTLHRHKQEGILGLGKAVSFKPSRWFTAKNVMCISRY